MRAQARHRAVVFLTVTVISVFLMSGVAAATLVKLSVPKMTRLSRNVVVGTVFSATPRYIPPSDGVSLPTIETVVRVRVGDALKGKPGRWVTVHVPGGAIGAETLVVEEAPAFSPGEKCIVFLDAKGRVVGWQQGKVEVVDGRVPAWGASLSAAKSRVRAATGADTRTRVARPSRVATGGVSLTLTPEETAAARVPSVPAGGVSSRATTTILSDGFESGMTNWTLSGVRQWGRTTYRAQAGSYSAYCVQSTTPAPGPYPNNSDSRMKYGPFDLSDATAAALVLDEWFQLGAGDAFSYLTSIDGSNFFGEGWGGSTGGWYHDVLDLSDVPVASGGVRGSRLGQTQVWVMLRFYSDFSGVGQGAYVDNVVISKDYASASDPTITNISPGTGSAGTDTAVTITGTSFGASQGAGKVEFFYRSGQPKIAASVSSWSDTQIVCTIPTGDVGGYPASAASGPVTVTSNAGLTSAGYDFTVTFGYGGVKWASPGVTYRVNANTSDSTQELALVDAAMLTWNPPSLFLLTDGGTCTTTTYPAPHDGNNDIYWASSGMPPGALAVNSHWYTGSTIVESDIAFADSYLWNDGSGGSHDIQSTATHELGHSINLRDLYGTGDTGDIMYGIGSAGEVKRTLSADDTAGVVWVYGARPPMSGTVRVAGDAAYTATQSVTLNSAVVNATQMRFSNDNAAWSGWEAYAATKSGWSLTAGDGGKTVYGQYKDAGGNVYAQTDAIVLDTTAPVTTDNHDGASHAVFTLVLSPSDARSGVAATEYRVDGGGWVGGTSVTLRKAIRHKRGGYSSGPHTVDYRSIDNAGNVETFKSCVVTMS